jgi:hypothetical protein
LRQKLIGKYLNNYQIIYVEAMDLSASIKMMIKAESPLAAYASVFDIDPDEVECSEFTSNKDGDVFLGNLEECIVVITPINT